jgi:SAM-dependent methyltransferase
LANTQYIHGTTPCEQERLALLNDLTNPAFLDFLEIEAHYQVLEIGSGLGILASEVAKRLDGKGSMIGIEISQEQLEKAPKDIPNLSFVQGDASQLPFEDNTFDVVYGRYILEHVLHPIQVLNEIRRVLKPSGKVFFQENAIEFVRFYPDCPTFDMVWRQFLTLQSQLGGDGMIGIKLHYLLHHTSFKALRLSIAPEVHAPESGRFIDWVHNIIGNIKSGEVSLIEKGLATPLQIKQAIAELIALTQRTDASAYFYWNRIAGKKS